MGGMRKPTGGMEIENERIKPQWQQSPKRKITGEITGDEHTDLRWDFRGSKRSAGKRRVQGGDS